MKAATVTAKFEQELESLRLWDGSAVPAALRARLQREFQRWQLVEQQKQRMHSHRPSSFARSSGLCSRSPAGGGGRVGHGREASFTAAADGARRTPRWRRWR